jgi:hypothetical protein
VRTDICSELYLWNKNVDSLVRVLQRLESLRILPGQTLKECEIRLEELGCALNVGILEGTLQQERTDHWRLHQQRSAWEQAASKETTQ